MLDSKAMHYIYSYFFVRCQVTSFSFESVDSCHAISLDQDLVRSLYKLTSNSDVQCIYCRLHFRCDVTAQQVFHLATAALFAPLASNPKSVTGRLHFGAKRCISYNCDPHITTSCG